MVHLHFYMLMLVWLSIQGEDGEANGHKSGLRVGDVRAAVCVCPYFDHGVSVYVFNTRWNVWLFTRSLSS